MAAANTRVHTDIDYGKAGKQIGFLDVPHSRSSSAWGSVMVPIAVIKNGSGPTACFFGGNHGDEYEGQIALLKDVRELDPDRVAGTVIIMPALNAPASRAETRISPIDGLNMNRAFPGKRTGSVTEMIAHYVDSILLPMADVVVDIHSGGRSLDFFPSVVMHDLDDKGQMRKTLNALKAFGGPMGVILRELDQQGMLDVAAEEKGKVFLSTEMRGAARLDTDALRITEMGLYGVLEHFQIVRKTPDPPEPMQVAEEQRMMHVPDSTFFSKAPADGIYESFFALGEAVQVGDPVGQIHFVEDPLRPPEAVVAKQTGILYGTRATARVEHGDCVAILAVDIDAESKLKPVQEIPSLDSLAPELEEDPTLV